MRPIGAARLVRIIKVGVREAKRPGVGTRDEAVLKPLVGTRSAGTRPKPLSELFRMAFEVHAFLFAARF